jgi:hypothetical protein
MVRRVSMAGAAEQTASRAGDGGEGERDFREPRLIR